MAMECAMQSRVRDGHGLCMADAPALLPCPQVMHLHSAATLTKVPCNSIHQPVEAYTTHTQRPTLPGWMILFDCSPEDFQTNNMHRQAESCCSRAVQMIMVQKGVPLLAMIELLQIP